MPGSACKSAYKYEIIVKFISFFGKFQKNLLTKSRFCNKINQHNCEMCIYVGGARR